MSLSLDDLVAIERLFRRVVREEIANANHSGRTSPVEIGASGHEDQCDEATKRESMDRTSTATSGETTMSYEEAMERGRRFTMSILRGNSPKARSAARGKRKASP